MNERFTPTEQHLFDYLVANKGRVIGYAELVRVMAVHRRVYTPVWTFAREGPMGFLRQYISRLRKKIERDPALPDLIITHRGWGYSFEGGRR